MGPRFFNRGKGKRAARDVHHKDGLQWGRGFSTAESGKFSGMMAEQSKTLQWGRGFSTAERRIQVRMVDPEGVASMGPRFFNRGKLFDNVVRWN